MGRNEGKLNRSGYALFAYEARGAFTQCKAVCTGTSNGAQPAFPPIFEMITKFSNASSQTKRKHFYDTSPLVIVIMNKYLLFIH